MLGNTRAEQLYESDGCRSDGLRRVATVWCDRRGDQLQPRSVGADQETSAATGRELLGTLPQYGGMAADIDEVYPAFIAVRSARRTSLHQ